MCADDFIERAEIAAMAVGRRRADAPQTRRQEHIAFDEACACKFIAERVDLPRRPSNGLEIAE